MLPELPCGEPFCLCTFILLTVGWISHSLPSFAIVFPLLLYLTVVWGPKTALLERRFALRQFYLNTCIYMSPKYAACTRYYPPPHPCTFSAPTLPFFSVCALKNSSSSSPGCDWLFLAALLRTDVVLSQQDPANESNSVPFCRRRAGRELPVRREETGTEERSGSAGGAGEGRSGEE